MMPKVFESMNETLCPLTFRAMNTSIEIEFWGKENEVENMGNLARRWFQNAEERFSRFQSKSELSNLNRCAGQRFMVSAAMLDVLLNAEKYRKATGGIFDPLISKALQHAGYNDSYDIVKFRTPDQTIDAQDFQRQQTMMIDPVTQTIALPPQTDMDLGGSAF